MTPLRIPSDIAHMIINLCKGSETQVTPIHVSSVGDREVERTGGISSCVRSEAPYIGVFFESIGNSEVSSWESYVSKYAGTDSNDA